MFGSRYLLATFAALWLGGCDQPGSETMSTVQAGEQKSDVWVMGYLPGWLQGPQDNGKYPSSKIDFGAMTHLAHFALMPTADGGLEGESSMLTPKQSEIAVANAHEAGVKILISIGGWASEESFRASTNDQNIDKFVETLVSYMQNYGYDGIDLDWEILKAKDEAQFVRLVEKLRARLDQISPRPLLTAATQWEYQILAKVEKHLDQINLMTYDLSGAWPGSKVAHHAALYGPKGQKTVTTEIDKCLALGIPAAKLGIGMAFYAYTWTNVNTPGQAWTETPKTKTLNYNVLVEKYFENAVKWDDAASAPYISIDKEGIENDLFITFDNEYSIKAKMNYVRARGLGGAIIWSLGGDNMADGSTPLLDAVKTSLNK